MFIFYFYCLIAAQIDRIKNYTVFYIKIKCPNLMVSPRKKKTSDLISQRKIKLCRATNKLYFQTICLNFWWLEVLAPESHAFYTNLLKVNVSIGQNWTKFKHLNSTTKFANLIRFYHVALLASIFYIYK